MNSTLSIILLSYNSSINLKLCAERIQNVFGEHNIPYELIIIDDGSKDDSYSIALALEQQDEKIKSFQLSKNYSSHYAAFAGLSVCKGHCAVLIPDDEQLPYKDIISMYHLWEQGHKIIIPYRESRNDNIIKSHTSILFYKLMNKFSEIQFPPGGADSFLIDREIIDIINNRIHPIHTTSITEILRLGFNPYFFPYIRPKGNNVKSRWTLQKKYKLAKEFFFSSSTFPIKLITYIGIIFSLFSFSIILFYTYIKLYGNRYFWRLDEVPGWVSTIVIISFFSGLILFSLGIIAEYIWRLYDEVKSRPGYIIRRK